MEKCQVSGCPDAVFVKSRGLCKKHYTRWYRTGEVGQAGRLRSDGDPRDRWQQYIEVQSPGCWIWTGSLDRYGYGQFDVRLDGKRKNWRAHRWVYTMLVRDIEGEELDHLCRVHACVNPDHLEPVLHRVNVDRGSSGVGRLRKTHCKQGHEFTPENIRIEKSGQRTCLTCARVWAREAQARYRAKKRAAAN